MNTPLNEVALRDIRVCKTIVEMLPRAAQSTCSNSDTFPVDLIKEIANGPSTQTIGDLVLELTIMLTDGQLAEQIEIDASAVELVPAALGDEVSEDLRWARLAFDLSRPDWTVVVSLQALQEASETEPRADGILRILVRPGLDFRAWLAEERTQAMLHEWYVQYQVTGTLHSELQLAELHEELSWVEERGRFVLASQLTPKSLAEATWQLHEIRAAGGARPWACQLWDRSDRPVVLAENGSGERDDVIGELTAGAERLLALAAER